MHPLQNGSQATARPANKPTVGLGGWFTESGDNNVPSYPGADWFNKNIAEFQNALQALDLQFYSTDELNFSRLVGKIIDNTSATESQIIGSEVFPSSPFDYLSLGLLDETVPLGTEVLRIEVDGKVSIFYDETGGFSEAQRNITEIQANLYAGYDVTTTDGVFEFVSKNIKSLRGDNPLKLTSPLGYGAIGYDSNNIIDSYAASQRCIDESKGKIVYIAQFFYCSQGLLTPDSADYQEYGFKMYGCNSGGAGFIFANYVLRGFSLRQMPLDEEDLSDPANYTYTGTIERNINLEDLSFISSGLTKPALSRGLFLYYTSMVTTRNIICQGFQTGTDLWCWASTIKSSRNRDCDVGMSYFTGTTTSIISPYSGDCRIGYLVGGKEDTISGEVGYPIARPIGTTFLNPAADAITQDAYYINDTAGITLIGPCNEGSNKSMFNIRKSNGAVEIINPVHAALPAFPTSENFIKFGSGYNRQVSVTGFAAQLVYSDAITASEAIEPQRSRSVLKLANFFDLKGNDLGNITVDFAQSVSQTIEEDNLANLIQGNCFIDVPKQVIGFGRKKGSMAKFNVMSRIEEDGTTSSTFTTAEVMMFSGDGLNISQAYIHTNSIHSRNYPGNGTSMVISTITALPNQSGDVVRFVFGIPSAGYQGGFHKFKIELIDQMDWPLNFDN
ncbi:hypothetical protein QNZ60_004849 [Vibrio parahaemolyticus]|nr:hypothetical protein [Vibrio parahaemolyticus]ELB2044772.1 hypothetical protein [Vibrio parahaemolyticus]